MRTPVLSLSSLLVLVAVFGSGCHNEAALAQVEPPKAPIDSTDPKPNYWAATRPPAGTPHGLPARLFPADNWWNLNISSCAARFKVR